MTKNKNFDSNIIKGELETVIKENEDDPDYFKFYIQDMAEKASKYNGAK